jgi:large subunit ribosomal protein L10
MKKEVKDTIIVELGEKLKEFPHFYLVDVTGLNAEATSNLRRKCFKNEIQMVVVKNKLLHKAFEASDIDYEPLYGCLKGNTAVMFCNTVGKTITNRTINIILAIVAGILGVLCIMSITRY